MEIIKNIFALLSTIFVIFIIVIIFINVNNSVEDKQISSNFDSLKEAINYVCNIPQNEFKTEVDLDQTKKSFEFLLIDSSNNQVCVKNIEKNTIFCDKFKCEVNSSKDIFLNNTKYYEIKSEKIICSIEKITKYVVKISCSDNYGRDLSR